MTHLALQSSMSPGTTDAPDDQFIPDNSTISTGSSATARGVFILIELVLLLTIALGNGLVIAAFVRSPALRTISNYLILHLAIADLSVALWMPMHMAMFAEPAILQHLKLAVLRYASLMLSMGASLLALVFLTMDRFMAIVRPLQYSGHLGVQRCLLLGLGVWLPPLALGFILPLIWHTSWQEMPFRSHDLVIVLKPEYLKYVVLPFLYICFLLILLLYVPIFKAARQHIRAIRRDNRISALSCVPVGTTLDLDPVSANLSVVRPESVNIESSVDRMNVKRCSITNLFNTSFTRSVPDGLSTGSSKVIPNSYSAQTKSNPSINKTDHAVASKSTEPLRFSISKGSANTQVDGQGDYVTNRTTGNGVGRTINVLPATSGHVFSVVDPENTEDSLFSFTPDLPESEINCSGSDKSNRSSQGTSPSNGTRMSAQRHPEQLREAARKRYTPGTLSEIKMCKTGGIVFAAFFLCWIPFTLATSVQIYDHKEGDPILVTLSPYVSFLAILNSALNPIVYAFKLKDFKDQFRKMLGLQKLRPRGRVSDLFSVQEAKTVGRPQQSTAAEHKF